MNYNNIEIRSKNGRNLKKVLKDIKKYRNKKWKFNSSYKYNHKNQFAQITDSIFIENTSYKKFYSKYRAKLNGVGVWLGIYKNHITIIDIKFNNFDFQRLPIEIWQDVVYDFTSFIENNINQEEMSLKKINHQISYITGDIRTVRPLVIKETDSGLIWKGGFNQQAEIKFNNKKIQYSKANSTAITLSIARKKITEAKKMYHKTLVPLINKAKQKIELKDEPKFYDYFELLYESILFSYISIESFINSSIPENYQYSTKNSKGIEETWTRENIERWMTTSEKFKKIMPELFPEIKPIEELPFWDKFCKLEELRNNIVHPKYTEGNKSDQTHLDDFFSQKIFLYVESAFEFIEFIFELNSKNIDYPYGFGPQKPLYIEVKKHK